MSTPTGFPSEFIAYTRENTLVGIKAGSTRKTFLNIWIVEVADRFFSRSWNRSDKSWFTELMRTGTGQLKYGDKIINLKAKKLPADARVQKDIDLAYRTKYDQPENIFYSEGITQPEYANYTIEFFIDQK
jgi:hypothetical protein